MHCEYAAGDLKTPAPATSFFPDPARLPRAVWRPFGLRPSVRAMTLRAGSAVKEFGCRASGRTHRRCGTERCPREVRMFPLGVRPDGADRWPTVEAGWAARLKDGPPG